VPEETEDPVEAVRRWEGSGGAWEVVAERGDRLTLALLTCDRGETAGTLTARRAQLESFLHGRTRSDD